MLPKRAQSRKRRTRPRESVYVRTLSMMTTGGQGVRREAESEGFAENCRAVAEAAMPWRTGRPKVGQGRARTMGAKALSSTHRTKVFADGTAGKINA